MLFLKFASKPVILILPISLFYTWVIMDCNIKNGTDIDVFMMIEKGIRGIDFVTLYFNLQKLIINTCKIMTKIKIFHTHVFR